MRPERYSEKSSLSLAWAAMAACHAGCRRPAAGCLVPGPEATWIRLLAPSRGGSVERCTRPAIVACVCGASDRLAGPRSLGSVQGGRRTPREHGSQRRPVGERDCDATATLLQLYRGLGRRGCGGPT